MKAQVIQSFGDPSVFELNEVPKPQVKPRHVLIKVHATSVNPIDFKIRSGAVPAVSPELPAILHGDVAGVIEEVGEGVSKFKKGDEVFGYGREIRGFGGALAEFMLADENTIAKKPASLSMRESAAMPLVSITAWMSIFEKAKLTKGSTILIHAGVGGVGHIAVQLAKWAGATVYATVRNDEDVILAKSFGADEVINTQNENVENYKKRLTDGKGFDCIFDTVGGANLNNSFEACAFNGKVVTIAARSTNDLSLMHAKGLSLDCVSMLIPLITNQKKEQYQQILTQVSKIADEGKLKPRLSPEQFTLEDVSKAHLLAESGKAKGKVVVDVA